MDGLAAPDVLWDDDRTERKPGATHRPRAIGSTAIAGKACGSGPWSGAAPWTTPGWKAQNPSKTVDNPTLNACVARTAAGAAYTNQRTTRLTSLQPGVNPPPGPGRATLLNPTVTSC